MSMFPTPKQELESKIREKCFKEQIKLINEISKDIDKRVKCLFWIFIMGRFFYTEFLDKKKEKNVTKLVKLFFESL